MVFLGANPYTILVHTVLVGMVVLMGSMLIWGISRSAIIVIVFVITVGGLAKSFIELFVAPRRKNLHIWRR